MCRSCSSCGSSAVATFRNRESALLRCPHSTPRYFDSARFGQVQLGPVSYSSPGTTSQLQSALSRFVTRCRTSDTNSQRLRPIGSVSARESEWHQSCYVLWDQVNRVLHRWLVKFVDLLFPHESVITDSEAALGPEGTHHDLVSPLEHA